jgi:hypothetical protein
MGVVCVVGFEWWGVSGKGSFKEDNLGRSGDEGAKKVDCTCTARREACSMSKKRVLCFGRSENWE